MNVRELHYKLTGLIMDGHGEALVIDDRGAEIADVGAPGEDPGDGTVPEHQILAVLLAAAAEDPEVPR